MKIPEEVIKKIMSGEMKKQYGLETDSSSMYSVLRGRSNNGGDDIGDLEAQYRVYKARGLI